MPSAIPKPPPLLHHCALLAALLLASCSETHRGRRVEPSSDGGPAEDESTRHTLDASPAADEPDAGSGDLVRTVASYEEFCDERARLECERLAACCDADMREELCITTMRSWREDQGRAPSCAPAANIRQDAGLAAVNGCLSLAERSYAGCRPLRADTQARRAASQACAELAPPARLLPAGAICQEVWGSIARCESPPGTFSTCTPCADGCVSRCTAPRPLATQNQPCADSRDCGAGLVCRRLSRTGSRFCTAVAEDDAYCDRDDDCASGACERTASACAKEPPAIAEDRCERARALAKYGFMTAGSNYWLAGGHVLWLQDGKLWRAPSDGSAAPESRVTLPDVLKANTLWRGATDGTRLWFLLVWGDLYELDHERGTVRKVELSLKPAAIAFAAGVLWAASAGCEQVARDAAGAAPSVWTRVGESPDPGAYQDSVMLGIQGDTIYCASTDHIYRAELGTSTLREALRVPAVEGSESRVDAFEASALGFVLVTRGTGNGRFAIARLAAGATALSTWSLPETVRVSSLDKLTVDERSGRLVILDDDGLARVAPEDGSVARVAAPNRGWADTVRSDGTFVYWQLGGVLHRTPIF